MRFSHSSSPALIHMNGGVASDVTRTHRQKLDTELRLWLCRRACWIAKSCCNEILTDTHMHIAHHCCKIETPESNLHSTWKNFAADLFASDEISSDTNFLSFSILFICRKIRFFQCVRVCLSPAAPEDLHSTFSQQQTTHRVLFIKSVPKMERKLLSAFS